MGYFSEGLQTVNKKLQENLQKCSTELNNTAKVIEIYRNKEGQWSMEKEKKEEIQREAEELRNKLLKSAEVIEEKDKALLESNKSSESSKNVVQLFNIFTTSTIKYNKVKFKYPNCTENFTCLLFVLKAL